MTVLTLGTMTFGGRTPKDEALRVVSRSRELGVVRFDTANMYESGAAESILGEALRPFRDHVQIASKVGAGRKGKASEGLSRSRVLASADESLGRLGTDRLDLFYLHVPDPTVPIEETLSALAELVSKKKILAWGVSNHASWQIVELCVAAKSLGLPPPARAQQLYNALVRQLDVEYFAFAKKYALPTEVYNPLAGGLLTPRHASPSAEKKGSRFDKNGLYERRYWSSTLFARRDELARLAEKYGISLVDLAYGFLAAREGVDGVVVGPAHVSHLEAAFRALEKPLSTELVREVESLHLAWTGTDARYAR